MHPERLKAAGFKPILSLLLETALDQLTHIVKINIVTQLIKNKKLSDSVIALLFSSIYVHK